MKAVGLILALACVEAQGAGSVKLTIESPDKILRPGRKMLLRFMIENTSDAEARLDEPDTYLEGLEIRDPEEKVVKATGKTRGITKRTPTVEAGGFVGRTVDVSSVFAIPADREGWYRIRWSFGDAQSNELRVLVVRDWLATIETNYGNIQVEFTPDVAPQHVLNFLRLARSGFYEGSLFHRIIPGFMMQGGAPRDPKNEMKTPLKAEFSSVKHVFGTVSAARQAHPDSATSQFFICFGAAPHLDGTYTAFGRLVEGADVVKTVERVKTDHNPCKGCGQALSKPGATRCCGSHHEDKPESDVLIKRVTLTERKT